MKHTKSISNNSLKLLGVLSGGLAALSYVKWRNTTVVQAAFNPKKMKVGARVTKKFLKIKSMISGSPAIDCVPEMCKSDAWISIDMAEWIPAQNY